MKKVVATDNAPLAIGPYSQSISANNMLFISGQIPIDPVSGSIPEGIKAQTAQSIANAQAILEAASLSLKDVVKTTVFIVDLDNFIDMNEVYGSYFEEPYPARSTVEVSKLPRDAMVEIEMTAVF